MQKCIAFVCYLATFHLLRVCLFFVVWSDIIACGCAFNFDYLTIINVIYKLTILFNFITKKEYQVEENKYFQCTLLFEGNISGVKQLVHPPPKK